MARAALAAAAVLLQPPRGAARVPNVTVPARSGSDPCAGCQHCPGCPLDDCQYPHSNEPHCACYSVYTAGKECHEEDAETCRQHRGDGQYKDGTCAAAGFPHCFIADELSYWENWYTDASCPAPPNTRGSCSSTPGSHSRPDSKPCATPPPTPTPPTPRPPPATPTPPTPAPTPAPPGACPPAAGTYNYSAPGQEAPCRDCTVTAPPHCVLTCSCYGDVSSCNLNCCRNVDFRTVDNKHMLVCHGPDYNQEQACPQTC